MSNKKNILINRAARTFAFFLLTITFSSLLYWCSQIPLIEIETGPIQKGTTTVILRATDAGRFSSFFQLHDLSKTEYKIKCPGVDIHHDVLIISAQDTLQSNVNNMSWSISKIDGGVATLSKDIVFVFLQKESVQFFVKNFYAENMQMVRNFVLTEIILFLLAMFGQNAYKLLTDIFSARKWINRRIWGVKTSRNIMLLYIALFFVSLFLILTINRVPENYFDTESSNIENTGSFFSLYDISCAYQNINIPASKNISPNMNIKWTSKEIVEFVPNENISIKNEIGPKGITFKDIPMNRDFNIKFYTRYLQSENYQEIRLFALTTLLLFFMERSFFYFRKWGRNHKKRISPFK